MNGKVERIFQNLIPFLILGIAIALVIGLFIMFSYVLMWGFLIGSVMWAIYSVKNFLFPRQVSKPPVKTKGRIIEHNDRD
ncbi:hypothetical protein [Legionella micdadei]|uniref:Uncharacterized protein n=1 Tax=Legionella micdadei TaxID=451 RepID=A0A098GCF3_LEGMI|nr:hypothetical protein [Legionella micdadei]ARG96455.1 hypothetical protein B6N58_01460 [Legionella micdadei]ARG99205.1 hypothetical protein B6V88_01450 [Legionella micdadei]KTD29453.1 hypothetical protein Lmic_0525 [Legionella micdadei]NSL18149.1 hypothetical protein [Legionella micdadei]CEG59665.1 conserved protein of unknown function [Legionella micdadei]